MDVGDVESGDVDAGIVGMARTRRESASEAERPRQDNVDRG